ncbi:MAG: CoB--CoM heterodisulfide reductase iron-sulfur subunit D [Candidatus Methanogasteraceae archaeon]|nr:MAG: CoB--CoM heterodisulfide reductase iron-sulfur subunit D [ANME-2 cluster archaeon]
MTNNSSNAQVCYQCGTCTAICPVRRVVPFSPRVAIYDSNIYDTDTDVWDCLTCGQCEVACPQGVRLLDFFLDQRIGGEPKDIVHKGVFTELADLMTRLGNSKTTLSEGDDASGIGYFPGCVDFHDMFFDLDVNFKEIATSSVTLLAKAGLSPKIMQLKCCGHDQLWQGNQETFDKLKEENTKIINESGIDTLVVSCAECYRTFLMDYDLDCEVKHISQVLAETDLGITNGAATAAIHDACRLGRHTGEYDAPRKAIAATGANIVEMQHNRENALCCGVSSMMNCNDHTKALRVLRMDEAKATGADVLITSCPKCLAHLNCLKDEEDTEHGHDYPFEVLDLTVYLARKLNSGNGGDGGDGDE